MKTYIVNDKYLLHKCAGNQYIGFYRLDRENYYYCASCNFKCPSILITLPFSKINKTYGYFYNPFKTDTIIEIDL